MVKIGNIELNGHFTLAPMAGVTNFAFRQICLEQGAVLVTTEMVSSKALVHRDSKTKSLLYISDGGHPCAVQLFGHEPKVMAKAARIALELSGADMIDINMGCPVSKVVNSGDGCALMRTPELAQEVIAAVKGAVPVPVTVKFRKGWDGGSVNAVEFAQMCEQAGADAVAIHGRTRVQQYSGVADWDIIREARRAVSIPVIANGDVFSPDSADHILRYTGCELAMIGRGAFGDPWIFMQSNAYTERRDIRSRPVLTVRMDTALRQTEMLAERFGERTACLEARHQIPWYLHGVAYSNVYRQELVHVETLEELRGIIRNIKRDLF